MNVLIWFQRDLRVADHAALMAAAAVGKVLPVYVVDPEDWAADRASARQWDFVAESLAGLRADLAALGAPLVVRAGRTEEVLGRLARLYRIGAVFSHADPRNPARRRTLRDWAAGKGLEWHEVAGAEGAAPILDPVSGVEPGLIPPARALGLPADPCPHRQIGGREAGMALAESFAASRGLLWQPGAMSPIVGERSSSRLSAYLAHGVLSPAKVAALLPGNLPGQAVRGLQNRLGLRAQLLRQSPAAEPAVTLGPLAQAFAAGHTGVPFVDACLRSLRATGWINSAGRSMLASFALHHLHLGVGQAGTVLGRLFTDHDPALLWPQMRAARAGRITDPLRIGETHDPEGRFIRRWLPELGPVPDALLHRPWRWSGAVSVLGRRYPEALVDPGTALLQAREAASRLRQAAGPEDFDVIETPWPAHARRLPALSGAQLSLDL